MPRLDAKVAIITGAGTGIGRATAELFAREGAAVVLVGRREAVLQEAARGIQSAGGRARAVAADVSRPEDCEAVVRAAREAFGLPTVLVNNAGISQAIGRVHELSVEAWDREIAVNLRGPFLMTRAAIPSMLEAGGGSIVNVGSILSQVALPSCSAYNTSKGGLLMLTRSTAIDYAADGVRCNLVGPGLIRTSMTEDVWGDATVATEALRDYPMGRFGEPSDIAHAILHFASDESAWTTGSVLMVDGGRTAR